TRRDNSSAAVYSTSAGDVAGCSSVGQNSVSSVSYTGDRKVTCSLHICIEPAHHESRGTHRDGDRTATVRLGKILGGCILRLLVPNHLHLVDQSNQPAKHVHSPRW